MIMKSKVLSGTLIVLSSIFFLLSLIGIGASWYYNEPLTKKSIAKLTEVDDELKQAQVALENAQDELKRALRIVESAEENLASFSEQRAEALKFLDAVTGLLDDRIVPSLETSKEKLAEAQENLDELSASIEMLNNIPFVEIELPDAGALDYFIEVTSSFEEEIDNVGDMAGEASTFLNDTSYLLGGDLAETKENIQNLTKVVDEYEEKISKWREKTAVLIAEFPRWLDRVSALLIVFLLWFAFSQFCMFLRGVESWKGEDVLALEGKSESDDEGE